jgi:hypothetical protein
MRPLCAEAGRYMGCASSYAITEPSQGGTQPAYPRRLSATMFTPQSLLRTLSVLSNLERGLSLVHCVPGPIDFIITVNVL